MGPGFAQKLGLRIAAIENKAWNYIVPSLESALTSMSSAALPENLRLFMPDPDGPGSYPIVTLTRILLYDRYDDRKKAEALRDPFGWRLHAGRAYSGEPGCLPLPGSIVERTVAALNTVEP